MHRSLRGAVGHGHRKAAHRHQRNDVDHRAATVRAQNGAERLRECERPKHVYFDPSASGVEIDRAELRTEFERDSGVVDQQGHLCRQPRRRVDVCRISHVERDRNNNGAMLACKWR